MMDLDDKTILDMEILGNKRLIRDMLTLVKFRNKGKKEFFNHDGMAISFNLPNPFNSGGCGEVYLLDYPVRIVLKKYFVHTKQSDRLDYEVFKFLKELKHPNILTPIDDYYTHKEEAERNCPLGAYTYFYVESNKVDIINKPKDYLLENLQALEELFGYLSNNGIIGDDLKTSNVILNDDNIVIIDPDCFYFQNKVFRHHQSPVSNKERLFSLIKNLLIGNCFENNFPIRFINDLLSRDMLQESSLTDSLSKKLKFCKKISDYKE